MLLMADPIEDSSTIPDMDLADFGDYSDCPDNLKISLDAFFAILNEKPEDSSHTQSSGTQSSFHQGMLAPGQLDPENGFKLEDGMPEPTVDPEGSHLGASVCKDEMEMGFTSAPQGSCNDLDLFSSLPSENRNQFSLQHTDSENILSFPTIHSSQWFRPSLSEKNAFMDSDRGPFLNLIFDNRHLQNSTVIFSGPSESAGMGTVHSQNADYGYDFQLSSQQVKETMKVGFDALSHMEPNYSESNGDTVSSLSLLQDGETGSSDIVYANKSVFKGDMPFVDTGSVLGVANQEGDICASSLIYSPMNRSEAAYSVHDDRENCLTIPGDTVTYANNSQRGTLSVQHPHPYISRKETMIGQDECEHQLFSSQNLFQSGQAHQETQELSLQNALSAEHSMCQDSTMKSESSTDSSPIASFGKLTSKIINRSNAYSSKQLVPSSNKSFSKEDIEKLVLGSHRKQDDVPKGGKGYAQNHCSRSSFVLDDEDDADAAADDDDICILDDLRGSSHQFPPVHIQPHSIIQRPGIGDPFYTASGTMRLRADDERLTYRIALQDLSQPKSEASPPDGVLAVPLLRHQRIALSWMVQKETASLQCSGGILADDQGLGKTVSTIALILTERPFATRSCSMTEKEDNYEALDLDADDEDDISQLVVMKQPRKYTPEIINGTMKKDNPVMVMCRPAAGTLVVCPTSVLRQWADELQNKVPKQPLVDKDDEEKGKNAPGMATESLNNKKRKKHIKDGNAMDSVLLDSASRPLGKVRWFRVILDEAQSIKNHRTQVARACWGLRAKRRWCLSGTPIQNAVDDLYSYFRFLRYDPYAVYKSFCSTIKMPISRNPTNGYRKLQAVLKTIMLRRTKGTLLDGKPIISLPPKTVTLKKVDFSDEERAFYSTLEAESREQFKEYAAAGTVKQNYVNILLMLLRLRQACDHPLLVKGHDFRSITSMEMAKELHRDKQAELLSCLEACLAICSICNDPPEDAVVTICGHVFCNQCISEHLNGDDNVCPSVNCKVHLSLTKVFSSGALKSALSGLPVSNCCPNDFGHKVVNTPKQGEESLSSDSSKIKAALEILQSLPRCETSSKSLVPYTGEPAGCLRNGYNTVPIRCSMGIADKKHIESENSLSSKVTEKAIVFSQWTRMLDLLEVPLKDSCIQYRRLDGTMSVTAREKAVKDFNTRPEVTVMIMSLKAASLGLNMVAACHFSRLTVKDTVEDRILALQEKKREMVASAFGEDESGSRQTRLTVEDLKYLFAV
ncbi:hypothetical protein J5N97_027080 [Dioscorea zingiberensis]|uniref:Helicase-like transcription factor CHR28 n=1 Tax=Dioscorea zingiberensis TaxID=325984 RepID=A0A9D5H7F5_9LILI|nr:hypothetical protein J5N97_027080 [Dioscorea zingiberensis]